MMRHKAQSHLSKKTCRVKWELYNFYRDLIIPVLNAINCGRFVACDREAAYDKGFTGDNMQTKRTTTHLFVYGTLLANGPTAHLLKGAPRRSASVTGQLFRLPAGYPAIQLRGNEAVHGELVEVPEYALGVLDIYKGVAEGLYQRIRVPVQLGKKTIEAWIYVMEDPQQQGGKHIPSGRWRSFLKR